VPDATIALDLAFLPSSIIETPAGGNSSNALRGPAPFRPGPVRDWLHFRVVPVPVFAAEPATLLL